MGFTASLRFAQTADPMGATVALLIVCSSDHRPKLSNHPIPMDRLATGHNDILRVLWRDDVLVSDRNCRVSPVSRRHSASRGNAQAVLEWGHYRGALFATSRSVSWEDETG